MTDTEKVIRRMGWPHQKWLRAMNRYDRMLSSRLSRHGVGEHRPELRHRRRDLQLQTNEFNARGKNENSN